MFSLFKKTEKNIDPAKIAADKEKKVTTDNILEVFSRDMMNEKKKELTESIGWKDPIPYLNKLISFFKFGFFVCVFFSIIMFSYASFQESEDMWNISVLEPICFLFLGSEISSKYDGCSSVTVVQSEYRNNLENIEEKQTRKILSILEKVYSIENFLFSEDIAFILEKSNSKLPVIAMLTEFNDLKDSFEPNKKVYAIECNNLNINQDMELQVSCSAYSSDWSDSNIVWFTGQKTSKKISGTSISVASSFLNYIARKSQSFQIVESTKVFTYSDQLEEWKERYTRKTDFDIRLKYMNNLSQ